MSLLAPQGRLVWLSRLRLGRALVVGGPRVVVMMPSQSRRDPWPFLLPWRPSFSSLREAWRWFWSVCNGSRYRSEIVGGDVGRRRKMVGVGVNGKARMSKLRRHRHQAPQKGLGTAGRDRCIATPLTVAQDARLTFGTKYSVPVRSWRQDSAPVTTAMYAARLTSPTVVLSMRTKMPTNSRPPCCGFEQPLLHSDPRGTTRTLFKPNSKPQPLSTGHCS